MFYKKEFTLIQKKFLKIKIENDIHLHERLIIEDFIDELTEIKTKIKYCIYHFDENTELNIIELIKQLRNKLYAKISDFKDHDVINLCYELLQVTTKIIPFNNLKNNEYCICPITFEKLHFYPKYEVGFKNVITLTTGYVYDKEALLNWFDTSKSFIDPVTKKELPQFDIDRIVKLQKGLKKIQQIENEYVTNRDRLLEQQNIRLKNQDINPIKSTFLLMTHYNSTHHFSNSNTIRAILNKEIINAGIEQLPPKSTSKKDGDTNFTHLDLSGLYFYNNELNGDFRQSNLSNCTFFQPCLTSHCMHADLTEANLENVKFSNSPRGGICIKTSNFTRANLKNVDFTGVGNWGEVNMTNANLTGAFLYDTDGIKITGEELKQYLKGVIGIDSVILNDQPHSNNNNTNEQSEIRANIPTRSNAFSLPRQSISTVSLFSQQQQLLQNQIQSLQVENRELRDQLEEERQTSSERHHNHCCPIL